MTQTKLAGPSAASRKYDLLTALGAYALSLGKHDQRRILRLITLITARYNWTRDDLSVGQREIAELWCCDERTVKREMARLRDLEWLVVQRQGARGRVTKYRLNVSRMMQDTRPRWAAVGPDFVERLDGGPPPRSSVIPFPGRGPIPEPDLSDGTEWVLAQPSLRASDPGPYAAWIHQLTRAARDGSHLTLRAPSAFHAQYVRGHYKDRVLDACRAIDPTVHSVEIIC